MHTIRARFARSSLWLCLALAACGGRAGGLAADAIGNGCSSDADCRDGTRCQARSSNFPRGLCTIPCSSDGNCPAGDVCVDGDGNSADAKSWVCTNGCGQGSPACQSGYLCLDIGRATDDQTITACNGSIFVH